MDAELNLQLFDALNEVNSTGGNIKALTKLSLLVVRIHDKLNWQASENVEGYISYLRDKEGCPECLGTGDLWIMTNMLGSTDLTDMIYREAASTTAVQYLEFSTRLKAGQFVTPMLSAEKWDTIACCV